MIDIAPIADLSPPFDGLVAAYCDVYGADDEEAASFRSTLQKHVTRPGFDGRVARKGDRIVGFAYGFTGRPGQPWRDDMSAHLGPQTSDEWLDGHFGFAQFGVVADRRREGIGGRLHDVLIGGIPHSRSVLTVYEDNHPALAFYSDRGWSELGRGFITRLGHGPYVIMGRSGSSD